MEESIRANSRDNRIAPVSWGDTSSNIVEIINQLVRVDIINKNAA